MLRQPVCLAIDTNLLFLLLGYHVLQDAEPLERVRVLLKMRRRDDTVASQRFDDLWELFRRASRRIVTKPVIAETYGLKKRLPFRKERVWRSATALLLNPGIEEQPCVIRELLDPQEYRAILGELGPRDAGLIYTAAREKATLITADGQLADRAGRRGVPTLNLSQIGA